MSLTYAKRSYTEKPPFLSIITRVYRRPKGLSANLASVESLSDKDIEQIFITDNSPSGVGLLRANESFGDKETRALVSGRYVFLLDDDDFIVNRHMIEELKNTVFLYGAPDVIFFRMIIKINQIPGNLYPTNDLCWGKRPVIARIGGSCFVVKREVYEKYISEFAKARCGDFYYIDKVFNADGIRVHWLDRMMCETGKVSKGKPE